MVNDVDDDDDDEAADEVTAMDATESTPAAYPADDRVDDKDTASDVGAGSVEEMVPHKRSRRDEPTTPKPEEPKPATTPKPKDGHEHHEHGHHEHKHCDSDESSDESKSSEEKHA